MSASSPLRLDRQNSSVFHAAIWKANLGLLTEDRILRYISDSDHDSRIFRALLAFEAVHIDKRVGKPDAYWSHFRVKDLFNPPQEDYAFQSARTAKTERIPRPLFLDYIITILTTYKLLDWSLYLRSIPDVELRPEPHPQQQIVYFEHRYWSPLEDLSKLLKQAKSTLKAACNVDTVPAPEHSNLRRSVALFDTLNRAQQGYGTINNFVAASLHIILLQQGDIFITKDTDLDLDRLKELFPGESRPDTFIDKILGPLNAAILIDPVFLLQNTNIAMKTLCLEEMIEASISLGTARPPSINAFNNDLMSLLFSLAEEIQSVSEISQRIASIIERHEVTLQADRYWYKCQRHLDHPQEKIQRLKGINSLINIDTRRTTPANTPLPASPCPTDAPTPILPPPTKPTVDLATPTTPEPSTPVKTALLPIDGTTQLDGGPILHGSGATPQTPAELTVSATKLLHPVLDMDQEGEPDEGQDEDSQRAQYATGEEATPGLISLSAYARRHGQSEAIEASPLDEDNVNSSEDNDGGVGLDGDEGGGSDEVGGGLDEGGGSDEEGVVLDGQAARITVPEDTDGDESSSNKEATQRAVQEEVLIDDAEEGLADGKEEGPVDDQEEVPIHGDEEIPIEGDREGVTDGDEGTSNADADDANGSTTEQEASSFSTGRTRIADDSDQLTDHQESGSSTEEEDLGDSPHTSPSPPKKPRPKRRRSILSTSSSSYSNKPPPSKRQKSGSLLSFSPSAPPGPPADPCGSNASSNSSSHNYGPHGIQPFANGNLGDSMDINSTSRALTDGMELDSPHSPSSAPGTPNSPKKESGIESTSSVLADWLPDALKEHLLSLLPGQHLPPLEPMAKDHESAGRWPAPELCFKNAYGKSIYAAPVVFFRQEHQEFYINLARRAKNPTLIAWDSVKPYSPNTLRSAGLEIVVFQHNDFWGLPQRVRGRLANEAGMLVILPPTDRSAPPFEEAVAMIGPSDVPHPAHDMSRPDGDLVVVSTHDFMVAASKPMEEQDIALNMLDLPNTSPSALRPYCVDQRIWNLTNNDISIRSTIFPMGHMAWFLAACAGAAHSHHIDAQGLGSVIHILNGEKVWFIAYDPVRKTHRLLPFVRQALEPFQTHPHPDLELYALLLGPGVTIIMPPGLTHSVVTTKPTICSGGHYYDWATMQRTLFTAIQLLVDRGSSTNQDHDVWVEMTLRFVSFLHSKLILGEDPDHPDLPRLEEAHDWENLASLFLIIELMPILMLQSKNAQLEDYPLEQRMSLIVARGRVFDSVQSLRADGASQDPDSTFDHLVFSPMLAWTVFQIGIALLIDSQQQHSPWHEGVLLEHVQRSLKDTLSRYPAAQTLFNTFIKPELGDLADGPWDIENIAFKVVATSHHPTLSNEGLLCLGFRPTDIRGIPRPPRLK